MAAVTMMPKPAKETNFAPKRIRKALRKGLIRGTVRNVVANAQAESRARMEFYRKLRTVKLRRRMIAREMGHLATMVTELRRDIDRVHDRVPGLMTCYVDDARAFAKQADSAIQAAAADLFAFSRQRIWYGQVEGKS